MTKPVGLTKNNTWQYGIRRTVPMPFHQVWDFLFSKKGLSLWARHANTQFSTYIDRSHIRTKWQLPGWSQPVILQLRVLAGNQKTTIAIHVEKMLHQQQREEARKYWETTLLYIQNALKTQVG